MTYNEYAAACKNFSRNSQEWIGMDSRKFYTTSQTSEGWEESCDNAHGGLDVSWAFHRAEKDIEEEAPGMYARQIIETVKCMIDNRESYDTMWETANTFED